MVASQSSFPIAMDVVMRAGDTIPEMDEGDFPTFRNGKCTVRFPRDGNWATQNGFNTGGWDANGASICISPSFTLPGPREMEYTLQGDGNFVAYCGFYLDYATHTGTGVADDEYFMAIDDDCALHIFRGTFECDSLEIEEEIWSNVLKEPLGRGDILRQGQYVRDEESKTSLLLQSVDGNLVLYEDSSPGSPEGNILWAANMEWGDGPDLSVYEEFYCRIALNGHLTLVGIDFDESGAARETVYFDKDLNSDGASCFTVEFVDGDLVAVPCESGRRLASSVGSESDDSSYLRKTT